jgi:hypothetical protein
VCEKFFWQKENEIHICSWASGEWLTTEVTLPRKPQGQEPLQAKREKGRESKSRGKETVKWYEQRKAVPLK